MREMMRGTVSKDGTAPLAQPLGYSAGGKTGTAEKHGRPRLQQQQVPRLVLPALRRWTTRAWWWP